MALKTGLYVPRNVRVVTHWPNPSVNGDGDELMEDVKDGQGNFIGRNAVTDQYGNAVRCYLPPDGFINVPSYDHTDNWVRADKNGRVKRSPNGDAIGIRPGTTLVEYPDGSYDLITDDFNRRLFELAHDLVTEGDAPKSDTIGTVVQADEKKDAE